jgi:4-hydroxy-4-methyl-2-oxoglutarate aldolase
MSGGAALALPEGPTIESRILRPDAGTLEAARALPTATLHEAAGRIGALPWQIKPLSPSFRLCGAAVTVQSPGGDNLWLHRAIYVAEPGDVLLVHVNGAYDYGYWGEIMATAARARRLAGLVIDGCVRDGVLLAEMGFPVFARGLCIRGTGKDFGARGWINHPLLFDDVSVHAGDLIVGDADGVVAIPRERAAEVIAASREREAKEEAVLRRIEAGERTLELYNF